MRITILTLFKEMFGGPFDYSIVKNSIDKGVINIDYINIRDFGIGKHKIVDDKPYGGGKGMVIRVDVLNKAIEAAKQKFKEKGKKMSPKKQKVILLDPAGSTFNQRKAVELSKLLHLILLCGHYEGVDARIRSFVDEVISIGDFILTGGEIPAMLIVDSVVRLVPHVLTSEAVKKESFSPYLEHPQYTRPETYKNLKVPKVLMSGNHKKIEEWRKKESLKITLKNRPDLIKRGTRLKTRKERKKK